MMISPVPIAGEVSRGTKLGDMILSGAGECNLAVADDDVVVVTQKIVSKAEGRVAVVGPGENERRQLIEAEAKRVLRRRDGLIITETEHGFVCANAGVDSSNVEDGSVSLLPVDPDASARRIRSRIKALAGVDVAVIISDTFGRAWRKGQTNVAIGVAGMQPLKSYFGTQDSFGATLYATNIAVADELAAAAELVMGKSDGVPVALIREAPILRGRGSAAELIRPPEEDLFR